MTNGAEKRSLTITPVDIDRLSYGKQYIVGDKGRVDVPRPDDDPEQIVDVIRQATITIKPGEGVRGRATVGGPNATGPAVPDLFKQRKDFDARLASLETR